MLHGYFPGLLIPFCLLVLIVLVYNLLCVAVHVWKEKHAMDRKLVLLNQTRIIKLGKYCYNKKTKIAIEIF